MVSSGLPSRKLTISCTRVAGWDGVDVAVLSVSAMTMELPGVSEAQAVLPAPIRKNRRYSLRRPGKASSITQCGPGAARSLGVATDARIALFQRRRRAGPGQQGQRVAVLYADGGHLVPGEERSLSQPFGVGADLLHVETVVLEGNQLADV